MMNKTFQQNSNRKIVMICQQSGVMMFFCNGLGARGGALYMALINSKCIFTQFAFAYLFLPAF
jgi:hypothetical protein